MPETNVRITSRAHLAGRPRAIGDIAHDLHPSQPEPETESASHHMRIRVSPIGNDQSAAYALPMDFETHTNPLRVLAISLGAPLTNALANYFGSDTRCFLAGNAATLEQACKQLQTLAADVLLIDWALLSAASADAVAQLRQNHPERCIICLAPSLPSYLTDAMRARTDAMIAVSDFAREFDLLMTVIFPHRFIQIDGKNDYAHNHAD